MKRALLLSGFIGISISTLSLVLMQFITLNYYSLVGIIYLYTVTSILTGYVVYNDMTKDKTKNEDNGQSPLEKAEGKWLTVHTAESKIKGLLKKAEEDFLWLEHAFPLERDSKIMNDLILDHGEVSKIEISNSLDTEEL